MSVMQTGSSVIADGNTPFVTVNYTVPVSTNPCLVVVVTSEDGSIDTCTYNGVSMTKVEETAATDRNSAIFYLENPPTGSSLQVRVDFTGNSSAGVTVSSYDGVDQTTVITGSAQNFSDSSGEMTITVPSGLGDMVVDGFISGALGPYTVGAGQTQLSQFTHGGDNRHGGSREAGASPNVVMNWTPNSGNGFAIVGISLKSADAVAQQAIQMVI